MRKARDPLSRIARARLSRKLKRPSLMASHPPTSPARSPHSSVSSVRLSELRPQKHRGKVRVLSVSSSAAASAS